MNDKPVKSGRRQFLQACGAVSVMASVPWVAAKNREHLVRRIPGSDVDIPVIGMGSWGTFDIGNDSDLRMKRVEVGSSS